MALKYQHSILKYQQIFLFKKEKLRPIATEGLISLIHSISDDNNLTLNYVMNEINPLQIKLLNTFSG